MLRSSIGVLNPSSLGGGQYSVDVYFENTGLAKYMRVGDYIEMENGDRYEVVTWAVYSSDFISSGTVTVSFIDTDSTPAADTGFDSFVYTNGQADLNPAIKTGGSIGNISSYSGQDYEYTLDASWDDAVLALNVGAVGDMIVDDLGKEFRVVAHGATKYIGFRVTEVEKVGQTPVTGRSTLYRPTDNFKFFQGREISDFAFTSILNRDKKLIDLNLGSGGGSNGDWQQVVRDITSGEAAAKQLTLSPLPAADNEVLVLMPGVIIPKPGVSYSLSSGIFDWSGYTLDGILAEGDTIIFNYFS